jgi:hypothetical protein
MIAMLVFACLAGHQDQCRVIPVAAGFVSDEACKASAPLALGWLKLHPELELREGTRPICTDKAEWFLHRFGA